MLISGLNNCCGCEGGGGEQQEAGAGGTGGGGAAAGLHHPGQSGRDTGAHPHPGRHRVPTRGDQVCYLPGALFTLCSLQEIQDSSHFVCLALSSKVMRISSILLFRV
jgi:hypothetical protein